MDINLEEADNTRRTRIRSYFARIPDGGIPNLWSSQDEVNKLTQITIGVGAGTALIGMITLALLYNLQVKWGLGFGLFSFLSYKVTESLYREMNRLEADVKDGESKREEARERRRRALELWGMEEPDLASAPKGTTIDKWLRWDLEAVIEVALEKLDLAKDDLVRQPVLIYGPLVTGDGEGIPDHERTAIRVDPDDKVIRFPCYQLVVVLLSETRIATFSANFNFQRFALLNQRTDEYLYKDIVAISTAERSTNFNLPNGSILKHAQILRLAVPSGDHIEVVVGTPEIENLMDGKVRLSDHNASIRVIREMTREKKGG